MAMGDRFVLALRCKLTNEQRVKKGELLAEAADALDDLREAKQANAREFDALIKSKGREHKSLAYDVRTASEERLVECYESPRWSDLVVDIIRDDTGEVVKTRSVTPEERQLTFRAPDPDHESADEPDKTTH